jgi:hypothetical protein
MSASPLAQEDVAKVLLPHHSREGGNDDGIGFVPPPEKGKNQRSSSWFHISPPLPEVHFREQNHALLEIP